MSEKTTPEEYAAWWASQFPCPCGHPPERHYLSPVNGVCLACADCHGDGGALIRYGHALGMAMQAKDKP